MKKTKDQNFSTWKRVCRMGKIFIYLQETIKYLKENIGANWFYVPPFAIYKYPRGKLKRSQFICD